MMSAMSKVESEYPYLSIVILPWVSAYFESKEVPITFPMKKVAAKNPISNPDAHLSWRVSTQFERENSEAESV